jgi:hypothetical protein
MFACEIRRDVGRQESFMEARSRRPWHKGGPIRSEAFDRRHRLLQELADAAAEAERPRRSCRSGKARISRVSGAIRDALAEDGIAAKIDALAARLLDG